ncbi:hypothetical protein [Kribbella sp. NPDC023855]|uniref:hypothetical protein n=1 Tax=Kribbella sp. NPDC023855 TaxID=3154698 RepID=UPI00340EB6D0
MKSTPEDVEKLLAADIVVIAAEAFGPTFESTGLGGQAQSMRVVKSIRQQFGFRWNNPAEYAVKAVALEVELLYEQARVASRNNSGQLVLLSRGAQLKGAPDRVAALRELL